MQTLKISLILTLACTTIPTICMTRVINSVKCSMPVTSAATEPFKLKHDPLVGAIQGSKAQMPVVFAHGFGGDRTQAASYKYDAQRNPTAFFEGPIVTFNFFEVSNPGYAYMGQGDDYKTLHEMLLRIKQETMLFGVSRGAATALIELGLNPSDNVTCAILESPFDTLKNVVQHKLGWFSCVSTSITDRFIVPKFVAGNYDPHGVTPLSVLANIPKEKPIFLYCSKEDALISYKSTEKVYQALLETGHTKVYLLATETGSHANILWGPEGQKVRNTIHAFLKENNLPHNIQWAQAGAEQLKLCQPKLIQ